VTVGVVGNPGRTRTIVEMPHRRLLQRALRVLLALAALVGTLAIGAGPARAHSDISSTAPADGEILERSPEQIQIGFNEVVVVPAGSIRILDSGGVERALGDVTVTPERSGSIATVTNTVTLDQGWYAVLWRASSPDGHTITGSFTFFVGDPSAAVRAERVEYRDPTTTYRSAADVLRVLGYLVTLLAVGLLAATWAVSGPATAAAALAAPLRRAAGAAAIVGLIVTPMVIVNNALILNGGQLANIDGTIRLVLQTSAGAALLVRMSALFGLCTAVLLLAERGTRVVGALIGAVAAGALTVSYAMGGHAAVVPWKVLSSVAMVVHLAAAAVWLGGIPAVAWVFWRRRQLGLAAHAELLSRFSLLATVSVVGVGVGGLGLAVTMFDALEQLVTTRYGIYLLVKVLLVGLIGAVGAYNHFVLVPALRHAAANTEPATDPGGEPKTENEGTADSPGTGPVEAAGEGVRGHLRASLLFEAAMLLAVVIATGVLTSTGAPAAGGAHLEHLGLSHTHGSMGGSLSIGLRDLDPKIVRTPSGGGEAELNYLPGRSNAENRFLFSVTDADGALRAFDAVEITFSLPGVGIELVRELQPLDDRTWLLRTRDLGVAGRWNAEVLLSAGREVSIVTFEFNIAGPVPAAP
jgi:copper transport protein